MAGAGTHLHALIKKWTGSDYTPGCGCRAMVQKMDANPPAWSIQHMPEIVSKVRDEAKKRGWFSKVAVAIPGSGTPIRWLVREAVRLAEEDLRPPQEEGTSGA